MADPFLVFTLLIAAMIILHGIARFFEFRQRQEDQKRMKAIEEKIEQMKLRIDSLGASAEKNRD